MSLKPVLLKNSITNNENKDKVSLVANAGFEISSHENTV